MDFALAETGSGQKGRGRMVETKGSRGPRAAVDVRKSSLPILAIKPKRRQEQAHESECDSVTGRWSFSAVATNHTGCLATGPAAAAKICKAGWELIVRDTGGVFLQHPSTKESSEPQI